MAETFSEKVKLNITEGTMLNIAKSAPVTDVLSIVNKTLLVVCDRLPYAQAFDLGEISRQLIALEEGF